MYGASPFFSQHGDSVSSDRSVPLKQEAGSGKSVLLGPGS